MNCIFPEILRPKMNRPNIYWIGTSNQSVPEIPIDGLMDVDSPMGKCDVR